MKERLIDGDNSLFEQVFLAHFADCRAFLIQKDSACPQAAYDASMEALIQLRHLITLKKIRYGNLRFLVTAMARQFLSRQRKKDDHFEPLPSDFDLIDSDTTLEDDHFQVLKKAFALLGRDCRELLRSFYYCNTSLKDIAEESDRSAPAVRKQKSRCVKRLKYLFSKSHQP